MPLAPTRRTKTLKEQGQTKVKARVSTSLSIKLQEDNLIPEASQEARNNPEVVAATRIVQEIKKEEDPEPEMTDPNQGTGLKTRPKAVTDVASQTMSSKTATSKTGPA